MISVSSIMAAMSGMRPGLALVDASPGAWGHILIDEIEQWVGTSRLPGKL
jgi:hypothetical protein